MPDPSGSGPSGSLACEWLERVRLREVLPGLAEALSAGDASPGKSPDALQTLTGGELPLELLAGREPARTGGS